MRLKRRSEASSELVKCKARPAARRRRVSFPEPVLTLARRRERGANKIDERDATEKPPR